MPDASACGTSLKVRALQAAFGLLSQLNAHHPGTGDHSIRVARLTIAMWSVDATWLCRYETVLLGGLLHDAGKLFVDREILDANRKLSEAESAAMQGHSGQGAALLEELGFADAVVTAARDHHERWSGGGYPTGRPSSQLSPLSRAVAAADAFSAMIEPNRSYRRPRTVAEALIEMNACRGTQFDPMAVDLLHAATDLQIHPTRAVAAPKSDAGMARPARVSIGVQKRPPSSVH
jgi:putative nucleotidyltransferase with HDIG domain